MIKEFELFIEGVRWYEKGKLGEKEAREIDEVFKIGDNVRPIDTSNIYKWHDGYDIKHPKPGEDGFWEESNAFKNESTDRYWEVNGVCDFNRDGYDGQLIQLTEKYPWYQARGFKKVNKYGE